MGGVCQSKSKVKAEAKKTYQLDVLTDHEGGVNTMAISDDGAILASGSDDHTVRLWTTTTDVCECIGVLVGHDDYVNCVLIEETYVLSGSADKTVRKWDMATCGCVAVLEGHDGAVNRIICTGDVIFSSSYDRTARCWDFDSGECLREYRGHRRSVYPLLFIPAPDDDDDAEDSENQDVLVTGSADFTATAWSSETGESLRSFEGHQGAITCTAVDRTGKILLTGATDHTIRSWELGTGESLKVFEGHRSSVVCMSVAKGVLYTGSSDQTARSWVIEFGDCARVYGGHQHTVGCVRFHNGLVVTGCGDGIARCFDAKSGALKRTLKGHLITINALQVVDGKLYTGSHDSTIRVWDIGNIKGDTQFGVDEKDNEPTAAAAAAAGDRDVPSSKTTKQKRTRDVDATPVRPAEKQRIMIGDDDDARNNASRQGGHLISIGKTTSAF